MTGLPSMNHSKCKQFIYVVIVLFLLLNQSILSQNESTNPEEIFKNALYLCAANKHRESLNQLKTLLEEYPNFSKVPAIYYWIGINYKKIKNYAESLKYFIALKEKYPNNYKTPLAIKEINQLKKHLRSGFEIFSNPEYNELLSSTDQIYDHDDFIHENDLENEDKTIINEANENLDSPLISNVFFETDLRQALQDISMQAGIPIIADNSVQGYITLELNEVPFKTALNRILMVGGYDYNKIDNFYIVGSPNPNNPSFPLLTRVENIKINYLQASRATELLSSYFQPFIKANDATNTLSVTASNQIIDQIKLALKSIDVPPQQVSIEAIITEVSRSDLISAGIDWNLLVKKSTEEITGSLNLSEGLIDKLGPLLLLGRSETSTLQNGKISYDLVTVLQALVQDGKAEIKANPKVVTTNAQPANIAITKDQYFSVITGPLNYPYTKLEKVSIGIFLTIKPLISENDEITVTIETEVSSAAGQGREGLPLVASRKATTQIRVKDGEFITIGGLTQQNIQKTQNKIPLLGSIPILGYLFSHTTYQKNLTDIVILIRPQILR